MGYSRFWLKMANVENKSIPHELPSSHWLKATGQCVLERYLSATMVMDFTFFKLAVSLDCFIRFQDHFGQAHLGPDNSVHFFNLGPLGPFFGKARLISE